MTDLQLKQETIILNQVSYLLQSLKDNQQYEDDGVAEALGISSATWPLFGVLWPSALILATTVSQMKLEGKRILEIGCGLGLTSLVLHRLGWDITASDYHPMAQSFLNSNVERNDLTPIKYQTGNWDAENPLLGEFDLIIGSDVLYEPAHPGSVSRFIEKHAEQMVDVIIVDPNRSNRSCFTRKMEDLGYTHHAERFSMMDLKRVASKGRILYYERH